MSFFGFDTTLPKDRGGSGFGQAGDAFAGLSGGGYTEGGQGLDFEDTYDGLGDRLDETDDAFNDETFGSGPVTQQEIGRDFDFSGQTSMMARTLQEEQILFNARQPPSKAEPLAKTSSKPAKTGYERYAETDYIPKLEANASLWGTVPKKSPVEAPPPQPPAVTHQRQPSLGQSILASRKMVSLEEVEAAMRAERQQKATPPQFAQPPPPVQQAPPAQAHGFFGQPPQPGMQHQQPQQQHTTFTVPPQILQRPHPPQGTQKPPSGPRQVSGADTQAVHAHPTILQRPRALAEEHSARGQTPPQGNQRPPSQPRQILQNPNRHSTHGQSSANQAAQFHRAPPTGPAHARGPSYPVVTHPEQLLHLSEEERAAFLAEDARRAKRNHKIYLLSKDNGLMTPQDKNFITRIQLQQLVAATGGIDEQGPEAALAEDFYYQVYSQIRGAPRQNPNQPASQFAQTYLFQTGGRYGGGRRHPRGGDNHMQRMEQQVQRAVEAAKAKPKNKQLVIEGSLGKISFSNSKTPRPLLNIKRPESGETRNQNTGRRLSRPHNSAASERRQTLRNIESLYATLMKLEDHERHMPPPLSEDSEQDVIHSHLEWQQKLQALNQQLWQELKVMEPIMPNSTAIHPFIAMLSHPKGKKAIPRIFRHIDDQQRITILTMIAIQLDTLDVVAHAVPEVIGEPNPTSTSGLPRPVREEIELFAHTVMPCLFGLINDSPLHIITGLLGLILDRTTISVISRTKVGLSFLTMLISRAELIKQSSSDMNQADWEQWTSLYNRLFDATEPCLPAIFTTNINDTEDVYVWQFLAAMGVGANPEQQQRLVLGVKERVMDTVAAGRALPKEMGVLRLGHVNLFMRAIGLDVELLG